MDCVGEKGGVLSSELAGGCMNKEKVKSKLKENTTKSNYNMM